MDYEAYLHEVLSCITNDDIKEVRMGLRFISGRPTCNEQVISHLERMLSDRRVCRIAATQRYVEIRLLAAYALVAEREECDITTPVCLKAMPVLKVGEIWRLAWEAGVIKRDKGNSLTTLEMLEELVKRDMVPVEDRVLIPYPEDDEDYDN